MDTGHATERVEAFLREYLDALSSGDPDAVLALYADDAVVIGTGSDEWAEDRAELRAGLARDAQQSTPPRMTWTNLRARAQGSVLWASARWHIEAEAGGDLVSLDTRGTFVLVESRGRLVIAQSHTSVAAIDQPAGQSIPEHARRPA
jgi:ketosteroid isomerase-like protein